MYSMVSSIGMLVNKESISYEIYSSSRLRGVWFLIIDTNVWVSLILYSCSHKGFRYCNITLEALHVYVPIWDIIGWKFRLSTVILSNELNLWVLLLCGVLQVHDRLISFPHIYHIHL